MSAAWIICLNIRERQGLHILVIVQGLVDSSHTLYLAEHVIKSLEPEDIDVKRV